MSLVVLPAVIVWLFDVVDLPRKNNIWVIKTKELILSFV